MIFIGTAGWSLRSEDQLLFGDGASHLARFATRLNGAEINSTFYRSHRPSTYARWAESVPLGFRFAVKVPKTITHTKRLRAVARDWKTFLGEVTALGDKLGPLLVQLPPSLIYDAKLFAALAQRMRDSFDGQIAWEPRHASWFSKDAGRLLKRYRMARVAADPVRAVGGDDPGGWSGLAYWRLHGSPRVYYSTYQAKFLKSLARKILPAADTWIIFDNTLGGATRNALQLNALV